MARFYLLNKDHTVTPTDDVNAWARMFDDDAARFVALDTLRDRTTVLTEFVGLNRGGDDKPLIFETTILEPGSADLMVWRYSTWKEAVDGHKFSLTFARNAEAWAADCGGDE